MPKQPFSREGSDTELLAAVVRIVERARSFHPLYATGPVPLGSTFLHQLTLNADCKVYEIDVPQSRTVAAALPKIDGKYRLGIRAGIDVDEKAFAIRHELAHVLAEDLQTPTHEYITLADRDYLTWNERLADTFALCDLVPARALQLWHRASGNWTLLRWDVEEAIQAAWGAKWPTARIDDRAHLRVRLFREQNV